MDTERYYAVASFMCKDGKISVTSVTCVRGEKENTKFYPLMGIITDVEENFSRMIWLVEQ